MASIGTRSPVYGRYGMVATSQPLASEIGLQILKNGGNAIDAAIAIAAALAVTEPCSTGIGGDCFLLYYNAKTKHVAGLNGSGRSPAALTLDKANFDLNKTVDSKPYAHIPYEHGHAVTVPGAVAGWIDAMEKWGSKSVKEVLEPSIKLARDGFPVSPITSANWSACAYQLINGLNGNELLIDGRAPAPGEIFQNLHLANCLEAIANYGKSGYYEGRVANSIVEAIQCAGGVMSLDDLRAHQSTYIENPIKTTFCGIDLYEIPPNGQGITALLALNILTQIFQLDSNNSDQVTIGNQLLDSSSPQYFHFLIEALRLAFADAKWYVSDTEHNHNLPVNELLSAIYAAERAKLINADHATIDINTVVHLQVVTL